MVSKTKCHICGEMAHVLWTNGPVALCIDCRPRNLQGGTREGWRLIFAPKLVAEKGWIQDPSASFSDLRTFIDESLRPRGAKVFKGALCRDEAVLAELLNRLESVITPVTSLEFNAATKALHDARQLQEATTQKQQVQEQELREMNKISRVAWRKMATKIFLRHRRGLERTIAATRKENLRLQNRVAECEDNLAAIKAGHPSAIQTRAVIRLRHELQLWRRGELEFELSGPVGRVYWEILEPDGSGWDQIARYFQRLGRARNKRYDLTRLKYVDALKPDQRWIGRASFEGYVVFCFERRGVAVLECPEVGNALYLMKLSEWRGLSQLSKTELLFRHSRHVTRLLHSDNWRSQLKVRLI